MVSPRFRTVVCFALPLLLSSCRGYDTIAPDEAAWRRVGPELIGMSTAAVERCAGPPRSESAPSPGTTALFYEAHDLENYCRVTLYARQGRVVSLAAQHAAPEFLYLASGTNYCGQIFLGCRR